MKFAPLSLFSLLLGLFTLPAHARDYYILFDANCMDRLSYVYETESVSDSNLVFHVNLSQGEKLILETGKQAESTLDYVPTNFISCGNAEFLNENLVTNAHRGSDRYFLVIKQGVRQYSLHQVRQLSFFRLKDWVISYLAPNYQFRFNLIEGTIGENIAASDQNSEVYFEGRLENDCSGGFIFRQFSKVPGIPPHIDILLSPEIGILEERNGLNADDAFNRVKRLVTINGKSPDTYLKILCGKMPQENKVTQPAVIQPESNFTSKGGGTSPIPAGSTKEHTVAKGETLYGISKQYNIGLGDISEWNKLDDSSLIFPGDKLKVSAPSVIITPEVPGGFGLDPNIPSGASIVEDDVIVFGTDKLRNKGITEINQAGIHTVQAGETISSLAYKYGYATWKFMEFNNLKEGEILRIGQQVKTSHCICPDQNTSALTPKGPAQPQTYDVSGERITIPQESSWVGKPITTPADRNTPVFYETTAKGLPTELPSPYDSRPAGTRKFHIVLEGETLYGIARKYQISIEELRGYNQLEKNEIVVPAQKIYIEP